MINHVLAVDPLPHMTLAELEAIVLRLEGQLAEYRKDYERANEEHDIATKRMEYASSLVCVTTDAVRLLKMMIGQRVTPNEIPF